MNLHQALPVIEITCFCLSQFCFQQCHEKDMPFLAQECREELSQVNLMFKGLNKAAQTIFRLVSINTCLLVHTNEL